ncbi:hypothetical protein PPUJ20028_20760 [Pseudomonas putida]|uniref:DUF262 domain-containing protein n=1 Tax=Pseudomonas putida TaxID=303 RepID=A0AA37VNS4_PSEPU|nr:hypothetical protein [Pseudomonas putida]GLO13495.1 hypothetical protein PPUJ20028_20760 [Pseudomonas putida]GLO36483.1 hypothetical protein PPUN14671_33180 [Pseudomonas putida]HDS0963285.1 hypothetical protein [Pseudomonas putida]HDS0991746.1 hypothetical protein [Pseudomonas putida]
MSFSVYSVNYDQVIKSAFINAEADYEFALKRLVPRAGQLSTQRELQNQRFYDRLARDILNGCIMPPLTVAIIASPDECGKDYKAYIEDNIDKLFILDGIQRLNTLVRVTKSNDSVDLTRPIYLNILICPSMDHLLYRMITLNNGQKPMTARHQIEIIAENAYDFTALPVPMQSEKRKNGEKRKRGAFKKVDLIKSYLAFLSKSINIDNDKVIQEKMDELIATKIMESNIVDSDIEFDQVIDEVQRLTEDEEIKKWFSNQNNLIAFCASAHSSYDFVAAMNFDEFKDCVNSLEGAIGMLEVSRIKIGSSRRKAVEFYFNNIARFKGKDEFAVIDEISMIV